MPLTFTKTPEFNPVWTPDSRHVVFDSREDSGRPDRPEGRRRNWCALRSGPGASRVPQTVFSRREVLGLSHRYLAAEGVGPAADSRSLGQSSRSAPKPRSGLYNAEISPDGRWIAYQSDEFGQFEVYVRPFPATDGAAGKFLSTEERTRCGPGWSGNCFSSTAQAR